MTEQLERVHEFPNPVTGELLTLASPDEELGRYLADIRDLESQLREAKRFVSRELLARMDRDAEWTIHAPGVKIAGTSPAPEECWDALHLRDELLRLVDKGVLSVQAVDAAVETIVTYKVRKAGVQKLRKLGGRAAEIVNRLCFEQERDRRVTVTRA